MGAKKRKRPLTNEEAVLKLEAAGYELDQFKQDGQRGYYVPLQLWSKYVGKFSPTMKRGWRVELNMESSRKIGRRFNMEEVLEMTASLGIGNGNEYPFDPDDRLEVDISTNRWYKQVRKIDEYKQPIKVGNRFTTNIIQAHRAYNAMRKEHPDGLFRLVGQTPNAKERIEEATKTGDFGVLIRHRTWDIQQVPIKLTEYLHTVTLEPHGVLRGIKQPYGHISSVYVHFFPTWKTKREARYHVAFDHGAHVVITNDWITRSWATTYPEGVTFKECSYKHAAKMCNRCEHAKTHVENELCHEQCRAVETQQCDTVMDYRKQNMHIVYKGTPFKVPRPVREAVEYVPLEVRLKNELIRDWILVSNHIPRSEYEAHQITDSIVTFAGGRM